MKRPDGRSNEEFRTVEARVDVVSRADGSALFAFGNSKAIVSVYGPRQLYPQHLQNPERCLLRCYYDLASFSVPERKRPGPTRRSIEISYVMTKALEPAIKLEAFPNSVIDVYALIIDSDASTRCAAINAASLALANAGVPMKELVSAVSVGKLGNELVVDLTKEEEDFKVIKEGEEQKTLNIILKADTFGSLEALKNAINSEIDRRNFGNIENASYKPYNNLNIPSIATVFNNTISADAGIGDSDPEFNDMVDGLNASIAAVNGATMINMPGPYGTNPVPSMGSTAVPESNGNIITASQFNKLIDGINKAGQKCLCNCNYCTCNCNYCTCNCNYCNCNCNYCTCDCNYCCTCNCNY